LNAHIDVYDVVVEAKLTNYPSITKTAPLVVTVSACVPTSFTVSEIPAQTYTLAATALTVSYPTATLTPACIGTFSESYILDGSSPAFVTLDASNPAVDPFTI